MDDAGVTAGGARTPKANSWHAEAPALLACESSGAKVGQALPPANPRIRMSFKASQTAQASCRASSSAYSFRAAGATVTMSFSMSSPVSTK
jgi:hypothetical protein